MDYRKNLKRSQRKQEKSSKSKIWARGMVHTWGMGIGKFPALKRMEINN